jgi:quercetin dioxygenase-like cupin family protein
MASGKSIAAAAALIAAAGAGAQTRTIVETDKTVAGQPIVAPDGPLKVVATRTVLAAGAEIPTHLHLWARYVYVETGEVKLTLTGSGETRTFRAGEMIVEPIGKWHSGVVTRGPAALVAVEQVPPGRCNTIRPPAEKANDC